MSTTPTGVVVLKGLAMGATALYLTHALTAGHDNIIEPVERPAAEGAPATVLEQHADDCWTGEAPEGADFPGAVIWQHPDGRTVYSKRLVGPALDAIFGEGDLPGRVIAFCR